jgi:ADP-ribosylglycohydrolase
MQIPIEMAVDVRGYLHLFEEQGRDVGDLRARLTRLEEQVAREHRRDSSEWRQLEEEVLALDARLPEEEPTELELIQAARPEGRTDRYPADAVPTGDALREKIAGAWLGRIAGCTLGKPVEPLMRQAETSRQRQKQLLEQAGEYPLSDYFTEQTLRPYWEEMGDAPKWFTGWAGTLRGHIEKGPTDDDLNYTVLSIDLLKKFGDAFGPDDVLSTWQGKLPYHAVCTAEKAAYRNAVMGFSYPQVATFLNPYREWIGAQIRADAYGYVQPGRPEEAARLAWHDAAASHVKNGVYGAMWVAAAVAAAFCENDPQTVIERGLEQVPADSRFHAHMQQTVAAAKRNGDDFEATFDDIQRRLGHYHCVHAINNACLVAAGLMHGGHDYTRVIGIAVMGGLDTDCNGATAGSIAGVMLGRADIPERWYDVFHDRLTSAVRGREDNRISGLIDETAELASALAT